MPQQPDPLLNPGTLQPLQEEELYPIFCQALAHQEMDGKTAYVDIPEEIQEVYKMYRPSPLIRAYHLEKALGTPAKIYYKFEGNNTSGSHKLNSAVAQAYYCVSASGITPPFLCCQGVGCHVAASVKPCCQEGAFFANLVSLNLLINFGVLFSFTLLISITSTIFLL